MKLRLKAAVWKALTNPDADMLTEALDKLADMRLESKVRWRLTQVKNALCERPRPERMDEP